MATIRIVEVNIVSDYLHTYSYEYLMAKALNTPKFKRLNNAKELIDKELRQNGFKPLKKIRKSVKKDNAKQGRKSIQGGNTKQSKGDSKFS